jgi:cytochrome c peroxidase
LCAAIAFVVKLKSGAGRVLQRFGKLLPAGARAYWILSSAFIFCAACKPSLRDPNWQPQVSPRMADWFASLNFQGFKGTTEYALELPEWFIFRNVPKVSLTREAVELGRFLFYEKSLSSDSSISCASCHKQEFTFADNRKISPGVKGRLSKRNTMPLVNLILDKRFFWDGRAASLEEQVLSPIQGAEEMDLPLAELIERLQKHPYYPALFERAYGSRKITKQHLANALAQFVSSIVSYSMPEEAFRAVQDGRLKFEALPTDFKKIWPLFLETNKNSNCGPCHQNAFIFGQNQFENVMPDNTSDPGYFVVTKNQADFGKFKVPALRNIALTGPYMHDGSVTDLRAALSHYRAGRFSDTRDAYRDQYGNPRTDPLSQKTLDLYVKAYLLNVDKKVITDSKYSNPF